MRKSTRQVKAPSIFDPSSEAFEEDPLSLVTVQYKKRKLNDNVEAAVVVDNPWDVTNFQAFLYYECPECDAKFQDVTVFARHAGSEHDQVRTTIVFDSH